MNDLRTQSPPDVTVIGAGPATVVAVHGIQGTRASWLPVVREQSSGVRFVLPNLRGRGRATRGSGPQDYGLECYADDLAQAIDAHVGDLPYVLAGWSLGVSIALQFVARGRRLPSALMLVSGSPCLAQTRWFDGDSQALPASAAARRKRLMLTDAADDDAVAWTWQAVRHSDQRSLLAGDFPPAVVVHGSDDRECPPLHARWLADGLRAPLHLLDGVGHSVPMEAPRVLAERLSALLCGGSTPR